MKVVVRSSSLLFTLLSIILQVPIQRVKRDGAKPDSGQRAQGDPPAAYPPPTGRRRLALLWGARKNIL